MELLSSIERGFSEPILKKASTFCTHQIASDQVSMEVVVVIVMEVVLLIVEEVVVIM